MIVLDLSILNQKGTPMFNSDLTANRPAAGIVGRIFIAIDSPYGIFRDTGTAWDQISSAGGGAASTIYTADGTLTGNRVVSSGGFNLSFAPQTTFSSSLTAATGGSSYAVLGSNVLTFAAAFSSSNIGNVYSANGAINLQNFLGNATFAQANLASANVSVNSIDFGSGGHTITMTQSTGIRAMTGHQSQIQFQGSHNGTISHAAISQNLGFYRPPSSTRTLTITNAYSLLLNALDDYGAGFTFTNRWGIYQAGSSDTNYFAASALFGTTINSGFRVDINGTARVSGILTLGSNINYTTTDFRINDAIFSRLRFAGGLSEVNNQNGQIFTMKSVAFGSPTIDFTNSQAGSTSADISTFRIYPTYSGNIGTTGRIHSVFELYATGVPGTGGTPGLRYLYINPATTGFGFTRAIESVSGDVLFGTTSGSVGVGATTSIDPSVILQITSTTKGFRTPTMTNAQRIAISSPAIGLEVYCTDAVEGKYIYKSTGWTFVI